MDESQLDNLKLKARVMALELVTASIFRGLARSVPGGRETLRKKFQSARESAELIPLRGFRPEYADLATAEFRDALDDLLSFIESHIDDELQK